jgi:hypothetical protein
MVPRLDERTFRSVLTLLGASQIALFAWMVISPSSFFDAIASFGPQNDHYVRDAAMFPLAIGIGLLVSARRPSWRVPSLAIAAVWYLAHAINHLIDIGDADPGWIGPFDFVVILLTGLLLGWLALAAARLNGDPAR